MYHHNMIDILLFLNSFFRSFFHTSFLSYFLYWGYFYILTIHFRLKKNVNEYAKYQHM